jgi:interleukin 28/29 (interferon lambda)
MCPNSEPKAQGALRHPSSPQESPGCLQASVTFNLFRLLTRDLKCVSRGDLCV